MIKLKDFFQNQKYQLLLIASLLSIIISIIAYFLYLKEAQNIIHSKENELKTLSVLKTDVLSLALQDEINDASLISKNEFLIDILLNKKNKLKQYLYSIKEQYNYDNIIITDINSKKISSTNNFDTLNTFLINFIKKTIADKKIHKTDVYFCNVHNKLHLDYLAPILKQNKVIAVIIFGTNPDSNIYKLVKEEPINYKTYETYIARKDKDFITVISPLKYKSNSVLNYKYSYNDSVAAIVKAVNGFTGLVNAKDYRGEEVVAYVNHIPNTNWYMVNKIDKKEIYAELFTQSYILIFLLIILVISVFSSVSFIYSYRERNLYKSLYFTEQEFKIALKSIGDAVITTDVKGNVKFLNPVAEELTGWKFEEAIDKPLSKVFIIVNEITGKDVQNPVQKVLAEGTIVGLANHTLLISKDGKEIPIADSGAPIKDAQGNITGVVLVFRDQTKEREAKNKIEKSEQRLNRGELVSKSGNWELNLTTKTMFASEGAAKIYGVTKTEFNYETVKSVPLPEYRQMLDEALINLISKNQPYDVEFKIKTVDTGEIKDIHSVAVYDKEKNTLFGIIQDITERKKIEEKYRLISDLVSDYVFSTIVCEDGKSEIDWIAGNFEEITGYTLEEYKKAGGWQAHLHPDSVQQDQEDMKKILNNEKIVSEIKTVKKDKSILWVRVFAQPYWDKEQNRVTKIYGAVQNINERKLSRLALEESEKKFSVAFNESPYALSIQDENNIFIDVNQAFCDLTGYSKEEVIGKTGSQLKLWVDPDEAKKVNKIFEETGSVKNFEFLFRKKNGEIRRGIISASAIYINGKKADITSAVDITELKEKENKILEQLDELKRWQNVMLDREDRVIELKKEVNELLAKLGEKKKYQE